MKKNYFISFFLIFNFSFLIFNSASAQSPNKINYQAVARDAGGNPIASTSIYVKFQIHQTTSGGAVVFEETHSVTTNPYGLFSLEIGGGSLDFGNFSAIPWGSDLFFLEVSVDPDAAGGAPYSSMGTTQFLSVPYSLHSKTADSLTSGATLPTGTSGQTLRHNGTKWVSSSALVNDGTGIGIGTSSPNTSSLLDITSTAKGVLFPRMTGAQMNAIASPSNGLMIYNTDSAAFCFYNGSVWKKIFSPGSAPANLWSRSAPNTFLTNNGDSVGIGVSAPTQAKVEIRKTGGATDALFVSTNGTGRAVNIVSTNSGSSSAALKVATSGSAPAGYFEIQTAGSSGISVHGYTSGTGSAGLFQINNSSSSSHSLRATTIGSGNAIFASIASPGTGRAGYFENTNASNASDALYSTTNGAANSKAVYGKHTGTGVVYGVFGEATGSGGSVGVYGYASNASGTNNYGVAGFNQNPSSGYGVFGQGLYGVYGQNNSSSGFGVYGIANTSGSTAVAGFSNTGSGRAGHFEITGAANASSALYVKTVGTGLAGEFEGKIKINDGSAAINNILVSTDAVGTAQWQSPSAAVFGGWSITGNAGTVDGTNFLGTTDNVSLSLRVNNQKAGRIDASTTNGNTFFGFQSGNSNAGTNTRNTGFGNQALFQNTTGSSNTSIGYRTLYSNITGGNNTAVGQFALYANTANNNTAVGFQALTNSTGTKNTAAGYNALSGNTSGSNNTAFGADGLLNNSSGSNNTAIGTGADVTTFNLTNATAIGYNAKVGASNSLVLGGTGADAVNVGIGTTSPAQVLDVISNQDAASQILMTNSNPGLSSTGLIGVVSDNAQIQIRAHALARTAVRYGIALGGYSELCANIGNGLLIGTATNATPIIFGNNGAERMRITSTGDIGIGTTTPGEKLDVAGKTKTTNFQMTNGANANYILTSDASGNASWVAPAVASNDWTITGNSGTTDVTNFIGTVDNVPLTFKVNNQKAGRIDQLNSNSFFGYWSGLNNTGSQNSSYGTNSLMNNSTGGQNVAIGVGALQTNTTGSNNTAVGTFADVSAAGLTNATAIGANAVVSASNSLVLGNNTNVGIGIAAPTTALHLVSTSNNVLITADGVAQSLVRNNVGGITKGYVGYIAQGSNGMGFMENTGSSATFLVTNAGNAGIGTTAPESRLHIVEPSAGIGSQLQLGHGNQPTREWQFKVDATGSMTLSNEGNGTPKDVMYWNENTGNVGIGTTAPSVKLEVQCCTTKTSTAAFQNIVSVGTIDASPLAIKMGIKPDGTVTNRYGAIEVDDAGTKRNLALQPTGGNVGIGITAPTYPLHIHTAGGINPYAHFTDNTTGTTITDGLIVGTNGAGQSYMIHYETTTDLHIGNSADNNLITVKGDATNRVGIGTSGPAAKLDVSGTVKLGTSGTVMTAVLSGIVSVNPPNIGAGLSGTGTAGLAAAAPGDLIFLTPPNTTENNFIFQGASVTAAGTITIKWRNVSGGPLDPVAENWQYMIVRP